VSAKLKRRRYEDLNTPVEVEFLKDIWDSTFVLVDQIFLKCVSYF
jgi:hypothetical protein